MGGLPRNLSRARSGRRVSIKFTSDPPQ